MQVEIVMPKMGESIQEGKILRWMKKPGDKIEKDETILEISTDKVDSEIPSPTAGVLTKIIVQEQETVEVGTVIALIETDGEKTLRPSGAPSIAHETPPVSPTPQPSTERELLAGQLIEREGSRFYSPLVRSIAKRERISESELERIPGTGVSGRVTKHDIMEFLSGRSTAPVQQIKSGVQAIPLADLQRRYPSPRYEVRQMDNIQLRMAEHMVKSVQTSPHVGAMSECDITIIVEFRSAHAKRFEEREGFKLTYTPFVFLAVVKALKEFPLINSSIEGDKIILKKFINLGMAVAAPAGLIVPVIKECEEKNFLGMARAINDLAIRTRNKKLQPDEIQDGTFTITNYGVFGNIMGTPIINQPQVAILGVGAIKKRPVVVTDAHGGDSIAIRSMAILTITFDHRVIDGALGGQFLERVVENLQNFTLENLF